MNDAALAMTRESARGMAGEFVRQARKVGAVIKIKWLEDLAVTEMREECWHLKDVPQEVETAFREEFRRTIIHSSELHS